MARGEMSMPRAVTVLLPAALLVVVGWLRRAWASSSAMQPVPVQRSRMDREGEGSRERREARCKV